MEGRHEKEAKAKDEARDKKRLKTLFKANAAVAIMKISEQNDPTSMRKRSSLTLPSPQVTEGELEDIVKIGQKNLMLPPSGLGASRGVTQALVGDYSSVNKERSPSTPMRTPMQEDFIMQEARNARTLRDMTPLAGEELGELYEGTGIIYCLILIVININFIIIIILL
jgi:pre-mRNA-splicing factor CDC5/CEF1